MSSSSPEVSIDNDGSGTRNEVTFIHYFTRFPTQSGPARTTDEQNQLGLCFGPNSSALRHLFLDDINDARLRNSADITKLITFTIDDLAHDAAHDLEKAQLVWHRQR